MDLQCKWTDSPHLIYFDMTPSRMGFCSISYSLLANRFLYCTQCSTTCGGGVQTRVVECRAGTHQIASQYCDKDREPKERNVCNAHNCLQPKTSVIVTSTKAKANVKKAKQASFHPPEVWKTGQWSKVGSTLKYHSV